MGEAWEGIMLGLIKIRIKMLGAVLIRYSDMILVKYRVGLSRPFIINIVNPTFN